MYSEVGQTAGIHNAYDGVSLSCYMAPRVSNVPLAAGVSQHLQVESGYPVLGTSQLPDTFPSCIFVSLI